MADLFGVVALTTKKTFDREAILRGMHASGLTSISDVMLVGELPVDGGEDTLLGVLVAIVTDGRVGVTAHKMTEAVLREFEQSGSPV